MLLQRPPSRLAAEPPAIPQRVKILSLGSAGAGKSCLIKRFCERRFVSKYVETIGVDFGVAPSEYEGHQVRVNFFDLSGKSEYGSLREEFYEDVHGVILVLDLTDRQSFLSLEPFVIEMQKCALFRGKRLSTKESIADRVVIVVCGNKADLEASRVVSEGEARLWAESRSMRYFEASASSGANVDELFSSLFQAALKRKLHGLTKNDIISASYTEDQLLAVTRIIACKTNYERLGLDPTCSLADVNKAYRRFAALLHPDKNRAPGSEDAFKALLGAKTALSEGRT